MYTNTVKLKGVKFYGRSFSNLKQASTALINWWLTTETNQFMEGATACVHLETGLPICTLRVGHRVYLWVHLINEEGVKFKIPLYPIDERWDQARENYVKRKIRRLVRSENLVIDYYEQTTIFPLAA